MIPVDFIYCRPETEAEAAAAFSDFRDRGIPALYYGGGSEIITMATAGSLKPAAVIDLKGIPELREIGRADGRIVIGGAATLDAIQSSGVFPLLGEVAARIADHTNQCRITLAGNLCGTVRYRETALPLLLANAEMIARGPRGERRLSMAAVDRAFEAGGMPPEPGQGEERAAIRPIPRQDAPGFCGRPLLRAGEYIARIELPEAAARLPYAHVKKVFTEKIGYPAVTLACLFDGDGSMRAAFSGICPDPFRSAEIEAALNHAHRSPAWRAERAAQLLPADPVGDAEGSAEYRRFLFRDQLQRILERGAA